MEFVQIGARPLTRVTVRNADANRIIEHVELNFNVNVVVDVSDRKKRFSTYSRYTEKSWGLSNDNTALLSSLVTLIIIKKRYTFYICLSFLDTHYS